MSIDFHLIYDSIHERAAHGFLKLLRPTKAGIRIRPKKQWKRPDRPSYEPAFAHQSNPADPKILAFFCRRDVGVAPRRLPESRIRSVPFHPDDPLLPLFLRAPRAAVTRSNTPPSIGTCSPGAVRTGRRTRLANFGRRTWDRTRRGRGSTRRTGSSPGGTPSCA